MRIALIGYGKMGRIIGEIARSRGHEIVCTIDIDNTEDFDGPEFGKADVAIEFTSPGTAYGNCLKAFSHNVKVVCGSTGWFEDHKEEMERLCREEGKTLFWASNFSVGVAIFSALNKYLARIMGRFPQYDAHMEEVHHIHKLDHPSGTAITLAKDLIANLGDGRKTSWATGTLTDPDGNTTGDGDTPPEALRIDSIRRGEVPGIHTITYDSEADLISITHDAHSRRGFALGAVLAAEYANEHSGLLSISDMFNF